MAPSLFSVKREAKFMGVAMPETTLKECLNTSKIATKLTALRKLFRSEESRAKLVLWVGAGVSAARGYPSWRAFIESCFASFSLDNRSTAKRLLDENWFDLCAEYCFRVDEVETKRKLCGTFGSPPMKGAGYRLAPLGIKKVITTNYDRAIEYDMPWLVPYTPHRIRNPTDKLKGQDAWLLKLHGTVEDEDTWTFTTSHYVQNYSRLQFYSVLRSILAESSVLILGSSLIHDYFLEMFESVKDEKVAGVEHYAVLSVNNDQDGKDKCEYLEERYKIKVIPYITEGSHRLVEEVVDYLAPSASVFSRESVNSHAQLRQLALYHLNKEVSRRNDPVGTINLLHKYFKSGVSSDDDTKALLKSAVALNVQRREKEWLADYDDTGDIRRELRDASSQICLDQARLLNPSGSDTIKKWYSAYCGADATAMLNGERAILGIHGHGMPYEYIEIATLKRLWMTGTCDEIERWVTNDAWQSVRIGGRQELRADSARRLLNFGKGLLQLRLGDSVAATTCFASAGKLWRSGHDPSAQVDEDKKRKKRGHCFLHWYMGLAAMQNRSFVEAHEYFLSAIDAYVRMVKGKIILRRWSRTFFSKYSDVTELAYEVRRYGSLELLWVLEASRCIADIAARGSVSQSTVTGLIQVAEEGRLDMTDLLVKGLCLILQHQLCNYEIPEVGKSSAISRDDIAVFYDHIPEGLKNLLESLDITAPGKHSVKTPVAGV